MNSLLPDSTPQGIVFNIQRYSIHDGGGIRTLVFLKGCPLRCAWCSNPESQHPEPELARNEQRCLGVEKCSFCRQVCPAAALGIPEQGMPVVDREKCVRCMRCASICPAGAFLPYGAPRTVAEVMDAVEQDSLFYARSAGGMTLSGGEPLMQGAFALALLREARKRRIDCAVETCGHAPWSTLEQAAPLLREALFDIKLVDEAAHRAATGASNKVILENFRKLMDGFPELRVCVRTPVIPGVNDSDRAVLDILDFLRPYPRVRYELLPYHRLGTQKYAFLDRDCPMGEVALDPERMERLRALVARERGCC